MYILTNSKPCCWDDRLPRRLVDAGYRSCFFGARERSKVARRISCSAYGLQYHWRYFDLFSNGIDLKQLVNCGT